MTFVQIIDCETDKLDDLNRLMDTWVERTEGRRGATHSIVGRDRDDRSHVVEIVEFPSYEAAMRNSALPETNRVFEEMVALCDKPPTFTDLDVVRDQGLNEATARRFFKEVCSGGDFSALGEIFASDYRDHDPANDEDTMGVEAMRREIEEYRAAFDFTFVVESQLADGDQVCTRWSWHATHHDEFRGIPATGRKLTVTGMTIFRFENGRIKEGWWNWDNHGMLRRLGL